jgi:alkylation response protein AidB-like acyl-CoA dehydrogenase
VAEGRLLVRGVASHALQERGRAVIGFEEGGTRLAEVAVEALTCRPVTGIDPELGLIEVTAEFALAELRVSPAASGWPDAVAAGQVALAHELVGASRQMLELARTHALEREQFGRPIAGFQAIRHRLAEAYVAVEGARACVTAAWDDGSPIAAAIAKAVAGAAAATVRKHAQQVLGGMGYTTEHPLHRYVRRTLVLDQLLGAGRLLTRELGEQLLRTRALPALLPL